MNRCFLNNYMCETCIVGIACKHGFSLSEFVYPSSVILFGEAYSCKCMNYFSTFVSLHQCLYWMYVSCFVLEYLFCFCQINHTSNLILTLLYFTFSLISSNLEPVLFIMITVYLCYIVWSHILTIYLVYIRLKPILNTSFSL